MRYAHRRVKSKRIPTWCKLHIMEFDDRPDAAKRLVKARENRGMKTPKEAATYFGWKYETYIQHEQGTRGITRAAAKYAKAFRVSEGWLLTGEGPEPTPTGAGDLEELLALAENADDESRAIALAVLRRGQKPAGSE
jgi:hypothetical protein